MTKLKEMSDISLYEYIYDKKWIRDYTWLQISHSLQAGMDRKSMQKKYKKLTLKLKLPYKPKEDMEDEQRKAKIKEEDQIKHRLVLKDKTIDEMTDIEIRRTKYGMFSPTFYISNLNNDDWIDKFVVYDYRTRDTKLVLLEKQKWDLDYLKVLRQQIWDLDELVALLPRGYGKTETVIALFIRWFLEVRLPIYIVAPSTSRCKKILRRMERILTSSEIRRFYGDIALFSYDKEMMSIEYHLDFDWVVFDYPVSLVTFSSAKEGDHPTWMHFEDVMQKDFKNIESNQDVKIRYEDVFMRMLGEGCKVTITGTRYGLTDFYSYLIDEKGYPELHYRALEDDNKTWLYCPRFTLAKLLKDKARSPASFETKMNNNPVPSTGDLFKKVDWHTVKVAPVTSQGMQYYMVMDPARGFSVEADNTAILVVGFHDGVSYVVDGFIGKIDDDEKVNKINKLFITYNPVYTLVESTFAQIDMRRFQHLRGLVPYQDTTRNAKLIRISAMKPYFMDALIKVVEGIQPYGFLYNEYLSYNETQSTSSRKDDTIDALSMIIQQFGHYLNKFSETQVSWSGDESFALSDY